MWQSLLKQWVMGAARDRLQQAASAAAKAAAGPAASRGQEPNQAGLDNSSTPIAVSEPSVCHVGLVFALSMEAGSLVDRLSGVLRTQGAGFVVREGGLAGRRLVIVESGVGMQAAARGVKALLAGHKPRWVISAGFAGGLDDKVRKGDIVMANEVIDPGGPRLAIDFKIDPQVLAQTPRLHVGGLLTTDRVITRAAEKRKLGVTHRALAVDMETLAVARACQAEKVRFLAIRAISDSVDQELPRDVDRLVKKKSMAGRLGAAAGAIVNRPSSIKDMWQLKEDALVASNRLAAFLAGIVPQLD